MAGDWIKMRGGLFCSPKLIAMGRLLHEDRDFRDWLLPGGGGPMNGQLISNHALRCVTGALLCVTWSWSREFGKALPNGDCLLPNIGVKDLDGIACAPGVGAAMEGVGWAEFNEKLGGVVLPKFFLQHNIPLTSAEKQRAYRERKQAAKSVTKALPTDGNKTVTREEKRRVYKDNPHSPLEHGDKAAAKQDGLASLVGLWNALPDTARVRKVEVLTAARKTAYRARMADAWWRDHWQAALAKFPLQCFAGPDAYRPTLDWFLRPENVAKILEGVCDFTPRDSQPAAPEPQHAIPPLTIPKPRKSPHANPTQAAQRPAGGGDSPEGAGAAGAAAEVSGEGPSPF